MDSSSMGTLDLSKQRANIAMEDEEEDVLALFETIQPAPTIDDRWCLQLQQVDDPLVVRLTNVDIWVQLHDLRPGFMSEAVVKNMEIVKPYGSFMRAQQHCRKYRIGAKWLCNYSEFVAASEEYYYQGLRMTRL
uniref:DUF4283 domain-containing protein n=1 Tax=Cannabis sativa TaxID=3483 RepID=A0A803QCN1_CANSA